MEIPIPFSVYLLITAIPINFLGDHRHNNFLEIDRETFENYVYNHDNDRENTKRNRRRN